MDAVTHYVESEHDEPDYSGSKIEYNQSEGLHIEDVQKEKHATNNTNGSDEGDNALDSVSSLSGSLLTPPVKLISAMKGSREKDGVASKKRLTVNWAPGVYDPPPTDLEALLTKGTEQKIPKKEKKAGRKQQKDKDFIPVASGGKISSKTGGKDKKKKQQRRGPGRSKNYNMFDDDDAGQTLFSGSVEDDDSHNSKGRDSGKKKREIVGFVRNYDLPPSDDDSDENPAAANHGKISNGAQKHEQTHENLGKQRSYDLPSSAGKKIMQGHGNLGKQSYDEEEEEDGKFSSGGKKNKKKHGNLRQQRCYDLPPEEDDEEEGEGVKKPSHGSSFLKHSIKEVQHSVA